MLGCLATDTKAQARVPVPQRIIHKAPLCDILIFVVIQLLGGSP